MVTPPLFPHPLYPHSYAVSTQRQNWLAAAYACSQMGARLVDVNSQAEGSFVAGRANGQVCVSLFSCFCVSMRLHVCVSGITCVKGRIFVWPLPLSQYTNTPTHPPPTTPAHRAPLSVSATRSARGFSRPTSSPTGPSGSRPQGGGVYTHPCRRMHPVDA
jgi:hypothetical protein